jgi:hypothetical protein
MRPYVFKHLTYANVVATVACFLALGGASYAAFVLPANSVKPRQLAFPLGAKAVEGGRARRLDSSQLPVVLARTRITLKHESQVVLMGSASFSERDYSGCVAAFAGEPPRPQEVDLDAAVGVNGGSHDGRAGTQSVVSMDTSPYVASFSQMITLPAGHDVIDLLASAVGPCRTTDVVGGQLVVIALPALGRLPDLSLQPPA